MLCPAQVLARTSAIKRAGRADFPAETPIAFVRAIAGRTGSRIPETVPKNASKPTFKYHFTIVDF